MDPWTSWNLDLRARERTQRAAYRRTRARARASARCIYGRCAHTCVHTRSRERCTGVQQAYGAERTHTREESPGG